MILAGIEFWSLEARRWSHDDMFAHSDIIATGVFGHLCRFEKLRQIARRVDLPVLGQQKKRL
jgi:hypothetical protein